MAEFKEEEKAQEEFYSDADEEKEINTWWLDLFEMIDNTRLFTFADNAGHEWRKFIYNVVTNVNHDADKVTAQLQAVIYGAYGREYLDNHNLMIDAICVKTLLRFTLGDDTSIQDDDANISNEYFPNNTIIKYIDIHGNPLYKVDSMVLTAVHETLFNGSSDYYIGGIKRDILDALCARISDKQHRRKANEQYAAGTELHVSADIRSIYSKFSLLNVDGGSESMDQLSLLLLYVEFSYCVGVSHAAHRNPL